MLRPLPMPVVASYCTTFLKPEMLHIYRQVSGLRAWETFVMTKERASANRFPFDAVEVLPRPRINFLARFHKKYIRRMEPVFYRGEYDQLSAVLARRHADVLHVYFGHTGVHLLPFIRNWPGPATVSFHGMDIMPRPKEPGYDARMKELLGVLRCLVGIPDQQPMIKEFRFAQRRLVAEEDIEESKLWDMPAEHHEANGQRR